MFQFILRAISICAILIAFLIASQGQAIENVTKASIATTTKTHNRFTTNYNYMHRQFVGNLTTNYGYQPENLTVSMHTLGLAYKLSSNYYLNISSKYLRNDIQLKSNYQASPYIPASMMPPETIDASTEGMSDTLLGFTRRWDFSGNGLLFLSTNVSIPTGNYKEKTSSGKLVSYQGQLGSGTYDFAPYLIFRKKLDKWELMTRMQARVRAGRNDLDYRLGDEISTVVSSAYWPVKYFAVTGSFYYKNWRGVEGAENVTDYNRKVKAASHNPDAHRSSGERPPSSAGSYSGKRPSRHSYNPHGAQKKSSPHSHRPRTTAANSGRPPGSFAVGNPFATVNSDDIFAAPGARWSATLGLKSGFYFGPGFFGIIEAGAPVYNGQLGPLEGLKPQWYAVTAIQSTF